MSTTKRISGNYTLQSVNPTDSISINTTLVTINGNLVVIGNSTTVESSSVRVFNANVVLNAGLSPGNVSNPVGAYIINDRGSNSNVAIRWNETTATWQLTNDGATYGNIATAGTTMANINITGHTVYDTANTVTVYTGAVASGKSGVYVDNTNGTNNELVTKSAAVAFSIIFG